MNVIKKLNQVESEKPYHRFSKLSIGYHEIVLFRIIHGRYGQSVIAELENEVIFLPSYLGKKLDENDISELNACEEQIYLYFGGKHAKHK